MKKILALLMMIGLIFTIGQSAAAAQSKILVAYFSRAGEEYTVGNIKKGNTAIVAEIIAEKTGADLFEIKTATPYPQSYEECLKVASSEKALNARPKLAATVEDFAQYDTIFIGFPIWYGDAPMAIYTFVESYNFDGKEIVPFCTHGGSGLSGVDQRLTLACPGAKILQGFEIRGATARRDTAQAESKVEDWLKKIGVAN